MATQPTMSEKRWLRALGATLWPSFLVAAGASIVFFANIDPETLRLDSLPGIEISRMSGYAIGFFMFWMVGLASSLLTLLLLNPTPERGPWH
ncbi:hypothetical protein J2T60_001497 [Natronospira proteinivora]|uniref:Transmembrane protein n=1 Tax=Natronospira proteinivora TaxID=1807133 RepID=A0ABT1G8X6_9GAMM|nr:hypothetical protein [Natronospira proteinivora]MCP1727497.1 hypothetical protein [Natronospira proteinivora]